MRAGFSSVFLLSLLWASVLSAPQPQQGGEGTTPSGTLSTPEAAGYSCDPNTCKLPACQCASTSPPGGLSPSQVPQFITLTADDAMNVYTKEVLDFLVAQRKNPNGCTPKTTFFNSLNYNNFSMVTDWYVAGHEIADHTMTHVGQPSEAEIRGNLRALNAFSGIPVREIQGFRAPFLNLTGQTLETVAKLGFKYDSSLTAASPANASGTDAYWPYTLDAGIANNCLDTAGVGPSCQGRLKLPGLWEIPMYAIFESVNSVTPQHLMDPWLDTNDPAAITRWLQASFLSHYEGNRQPFGLYSHPINIAKDYPGLATKTNIRNALNEFLDWAQTHQNVWIVTNAQMLAWLENPKPVSELASVAALGCSTPEVPADAKICNGIDQNQQGLLLSCPFPDFPWTTCYGCPVTPPTPENPVPEQDTSIGIRYPLPDNCATPFWDPVGNTCICTGTACAFQDNTGPIQQPSGTSSNGGSSPTGGSGHSAGETTRASFAGGLFVLAASLFALWA